MMVVCDCKKLQIIRNLEAENKARKYHMPVTLMGFWEQDSLKPVTHFSFTITLEMQEEQ